ncbi:DUF2291 family protein [Dactylosporangium maewongense]|uniref:DUF2291 family protein n=1 Tax=Dactylosporangium maewongense TaxID=634393 RepID=A0ABP4MLG2_9ACTN
MRVTLLLRCAIVGLLALPVLSACGRVPGVYVYEAQQAGGRPGGAAAFDAKTYVDGIWTSKIVPAVHDNAVDISTVAAAVAKDVDAAGKQYGHQAGTGSPYAFLVKGTGKVVKVDTSAPTGPVTVEIAQDGGQPITLYVATGPVIAGTAIRDGVGFISFGDFTNQIDYANVANEINSRVKSDVIAKVDRAGLTDKTISFYGAFSALAPNQIMVVPTELQVTP